MSSNKPQSKNPTLLPGYPIIEKLIETEDFSKVNESMSESYDSLEALLKKTTGGLSKQKKIKKALKAYDLTVDLIKELLKTKYQMISEESKK